MAKSWKPCSRCSLSLLPDKQQSLKMFVQDNNWASYHKINSEGLLTKLTYWRPGRHPCPLLLRSIADSNVSQSLVFTQGVNNKFLCSYHQAIYSVGNGDGFPEGGLRPDHSPTSSTEVKNEWSRTYTPPYAFIAYAGTLPAHCSPRKVGAALHLAKI